MPGLPDNASENGKPGAKIKGSSEKKGLKARSPNFPLLQIWLRLHHFMTMTEEQTLVMFFCSTILWFFAPKTFSPPKTYNNKNRGNARVFRFHAQKTFERQKIVE